ncbi:MAG TPA: hypothetical protein PLE73_01685 [Spirochaetota bacterium]|nr:hypothetical protein [Spirochaetota bacterium]HPI21875.1 hypothetical protein [Spirochaetota bacterium]HPU89475.1 hypothetical protein [Spirochaetota bacterium]
MNKKTRRGLLCLVALCALGCASTVRVHPRVTFPLALTEGAPVLIFPINLDYTGAPIDSRKSWPTLASGIAARLGKNAVWDGRLYDMAGNLSFELPEAMDAAMRAGQWRLDGGRERIAVALEVVVRRMTKSLVASRQVPRDFMFTHVLVVHSRGRVTLGGTAISHESWGGVYRVADRTIVSFVRTPMTIAHAKGEMPARLSELYARMAADLIAGKPTTR